MLDYEFDGCPILCKRSPRCPADYRERVPFVTKPSLSVPHRTNRTDDRRVRRLCVLFSSIEIVRSVCKKFERESKRVRERKTTRSEGLPRWKPASLVVRKRKAWSNDEWGVFVFCTFCPERASKRAHACTRSFFAVDGWVGRICNGKARTSKQQNK